MTRISNSHSSASLGPKVKKKLQLRKQPAQARSAETVSVILVAAAHILDTGGYGEYSTNSIARRAGVSIGSLYQYFPSKDAITVALIQQEAGKVASSVEQISLLVMDWKDAMYQLIDVAVQHQLARPQLARILDVEEARLQPAGTMAGILGSLEAVLQRGLPQAAPDTLRTLAIDVVAITRAVADAPADQRKVHPQELRQRLCSAVFGYLESASQWA